MVPFGYPGLFSRLNGNEAAVARLDEFAALGLYPAIPGSGELALGSPLFEDAIVYLADGQAQHIVGHGAADDAP
jgi:putative alpha-1,2-mannosidase